MSAPKPGNLKDGSSDDMIDIQIEESLVRETLMSIDSANFKEDIITIISFFFILVITALTGIFGPPVDNTQTSYDLLSTESSVQQVTLSIQNLSSYNLHMRIALSLIRPDSKSELLSAFNATYSINGVSDSESFPILHKTMQSLALKSPQGSNQTLPILLFSDQIITYKSIVLTLTLSIPPRTFVQSCLQITVGNVEHTIFQIYFRVVFAFVSFAFLVLLLFRLRKMAIKLWHLEQKLTIPLLVFNILFNDPAFMLHSIYPSTIFILFDTIMRCIFNSYFSFFVLVLFDSLRYKNRKTDQCFFLPKVAFLIVDFAVSVVSQLRKDIQTEGNMDSFLWYLSASLSILYYVWATGCIAVAACQVDVTERYKFDMYMIAGVTAVVMLLIVQVLSKWLKLFSGSSLEFIANYAIQNVFTLLMAYFHWPYEVLADQMYDDNDRKSKENTVPDQFFVNDDAENSK